MKPGQVTVLGLLVVLLALEALRSPNVNGALKGWFQSFYATITGGETLVPKGTKQGILPTGQ